ncbi:MAG TPA: hypothetical protein VFW19_01175 [Allosphingosinicella sp.]|nr:hypothetical protein [Allosphingosinicella sp.]
MRRRLALAALLLAAACRREAPPPPPREQAAPAPLAQPAAARQETQATQGDMADAAGAADLLRHYYALIEAGRYAEAWKLRGNGRDVDETQFAAHFRSYESYHSQVGAPSRPVASQGWIWVEVPVMTTGRLRGGKPLGSAGSITLRRPRPGIKAPAKERGWRIYTG